jgi:hypothetical protein
MITLQDGLVALSSKPATVFRPDVITNLRRSDNMVETLEELCKIIADTMKPNIVYLGHKRIDHRLKFPQKYVQMYDSDIFCEEFQFKITGPGEDGKITSIYKSMLFEIPTLIDGCKYYLNGVYFYPLYQLIDATTYHKKGSVCLKTLTIPIQMNRSPCIISDINQKEYDSYIYTIDMQKKKVNLFAFLFATLGMLKTIKFFEGKNTIFHIISGDLINKDSEEFSYFQLSKNVYLQVANEALQGQNFIQVRSVIATIMDVFPKTVKPDNFLTTNFWRYEVLASYFIKTKTLTRSTKLDLFIESYKRLYDSITKDNMTTYETPKENIYEILRWMFMHYTELLYRDNTSIFRKKVRLSESQIAPIVRRELYKINRVIHSRNRFKDVKKYAEIISLPYKFSFDVKSKKNIPDQPSDILIKTVINSNNTRYAEAVNTFDLLNILLRYSLISSSTTVSKTSKTAELTRDQRHVSLSQLSFVSLNQTGAGDPGAASGFIPFIKIRDGKFVSPFDTTMED